jgi:opacity protein-like surface antigen
MRKLLLLLGLELIVALPLQAQGTYPRAEIFGGYSYLHTDTPSESNILKGWNASAVGNVHRMIGIEADFSGHYGGGRDNSGGGLRRYDRTNFLFGPKFAARLPKVTPWGHALFGASQVSVEGRDFQGDYSDSRTAFTWAIGGGVDVRLHRNLSVRVIQADYIRPNSSAGPITTGPTGTYYVINPISSNNLRLSFGIVLTLGGG